MTTEQSAVAFAYPICSQNRVLRRAGLGWGSRRLGCWRCWWSRSVGGFRWPMALQVLARF